jgi:hypothetical protein
MMNTLVPELAMDSTSMLASRTTVAMNLAAEPKPGLVSVQARSLSMVFGTPMLRMG